MALTLPNSSPSRPAARRYLRQPEPVRFPVEVRVPESKTHAWLLAILFLSVEREFGDRALIASDQFLYWDASDPRKCLAPDLAIRLGSENFQLKSWKIWELGAPHVGVEIVSDMDDAERVVDEKLARYRQTGIREVVRFDPVDTGAPLRFWDLIEGDLMERDPTDPEVAFSEALGLYWVVRDEPKLGPSLRLARDRAGSELILTPEEAERAQKEAALARIAELEAELARR